MIRASNPDVICLQECAPRMCAPIKKLGYKRAGLSVSHIILIRNKMKAEKAGASLFTNWAVIDGIKVICVHSRWDEAIIKATVKKLNELSRDYPTVACGDFNVSRDVIFDFDLQMEHVRSSLGIAKQDTFLNFTKPESHGEIDHAFISGDISASDFSIITDNYGCWRMSDHYPIVFNITKNI